MLLRRRGQVEHDGGDRLGVASQVLVGDAGNAVVYVEVADQPVVVLKLLDIVETRSKEESCSPPSVDVLLRVHVAAAS